MKKLALIIAFLMILPGAAFGLETLNDSAMDDVTGQAGVSIAADDVQLFMNIGRIAWIDADGFKNHSTQTYGSGGAVGIENFQLDVLKVNAIVNSVDNGEDTVAFQSSAAGEIDLQFSYGSTAPLPGPSLAGDSGGVKGIENYEQTSRDQDSALNSQTTYKAITIDATSQLTALSAIETENEGSEQNIGGVLIGLPTMEFYLSSIEMTPAFYNVAGETDADNDSTSGADYGTMGFEGITFTTLTGSMEIAPH